MVPCSSRGYRYVTARAHTPRRPGSAFRATGLPVGTTLQLRAVPLFPVPGRTPGALSDECHRWLDTGSSDRRAAALHLDGPGGMATRCLPGPVYRLCGLCDHRVVCILDRKHRILLADLQSPDAGVRWRAGAAGDFPAAAAQHRPGVALQRYSLRPITHTGALWTC